ncbi:MAG: protein kinase [Sandaracinaceae bacterium]|nr:protein kinase [Sandaracinaceae bacterium]
MTGEALDPWIGRTIGGRYRLIQRLGAGGMSVVYLARHLFIDRLFAIKTLRPRLAQDPVQRDRFAREARAANRVNHENIVEILDIGETEEGVPYLVMEYVKGTPLLEALGEGPFPPLRALHIAEQIASALARAHSMGVIHRDLKPENILLLQRGYIQDFVKVLDFGIAKLAGLPSLTQSQQIFGTPGYIAPEYIQGKGGVDGRIDIYSLGVVLYEMVTCYLPFDCEYPGEFLLKAVRDPPIPPSHRNPNVPQCLEALILQAIEKNPEKRFRDAHHFLEAIQECRRELLLSNSSHFISIDTATTTSSKVLNSDQPASPFDLHHQITLKQVASPSNQASKPSTREEDKDSHPASVPEIPIEVQEGKPSASFSASHPHTHHLTLSGETGPFGVKQWRKRFEALQAHLDEIAPHCPHPPEIEGAMAFAGRTLEALEQGIEAAVASQNAFEKVAALAQEQRSALGIRIEELVAQLSQEQRELMALQEQREQLESAHQHLIAQGLHTEADGKIWELAALDQAIAEKKALIETLSIQVEELRQELEHGNQELESQLHILRKTLEQESARLASMSESLRDPLDRVECYLRKISSR